MRNRLVIEWLTSVASNHVIANYRIVRYNLPPDPDGLPKLDWFLLKKRNLFNCIPCGWHGACGYDRGASGDYNYQLECAANPLSLILHSILEIEYHQTTRSFNPNHHGRDRLPKCAILEEVDLAATIKELVKSETDDWDAVMKTCIKYKGS